MKPILGSIVFGPPRPPSPFELRVNADIRARKQHDDLVEALDRLHALILVAAADDLPIKADHPAVLNAQAVLAKAER